MNAAAKILIEAKARLHSDMRVMLEEPGNLQMMDRERLFLESWYVSQIDDLERAISKILAPEEVT